MEKDEIKNVSLTLLDTVEEILHLKIHDLIDELKDEIKTQE